MSLRADDTWISTRSDRPRLADYQVQRLIGSGGMARVFLAVHRRAASEHAVKVLRDRIPRLAARLRVEGEVLSTLDHPNVVRVTEVVESGDGDPVLVMEHVRGPTLADLVGSGLRLTLGEIDQLARGILAGVAAAHARGWVHRDLKPGNVLLAITADALVPKVADFGLVKVLEPDGSADAGNTTRSGLGTRRYMPLEQLSGAPADRRMDVFALGAVLYELIDGSPAFPTTSRWEEAVRTGLPPALTRDDVPDRFAAAVAAALGPRDQRPDDAAALAVIWGQSPASEGFRPDTLRAAAWLAAHLTREQISLGALGPDELEHLAICARCRALQTEPVSSAGWTAPRELPAERDPFVGRTEERRALGELLGSGARLISVLGPGGIGKTRLVVRYGWEHHAEGGVWFCDLSAARDLEGVTTAVARALGVPLGVEDPVAQLGHAIAARGRCLMLLDNLEQVADAVEPTVGRWLDRAPDARFVITSRHRLNLRGEQVLVVGPLDRRDAVALFDLRYAATVGVERAPADAQPVDALVELLDDLPLAIELAAARSRILPVRELLVRMADRFRLLAAPSGSERRHALRATLDWSWDLLPPAEAAALAQLAVFAGSFGMGSAEAVVDSGDAWVPDLVQALVDRSLLAVDEDGRFQLSNSVRAYAAEKAGAGAVAPEAERRMAQHFARLGDEASLAALDRAGGVALRRQLAEELHNLVAACRAATALADGEAAVATLRAAWAVLELAGPWGLGAELAAAVAALPGLDAAQRADAGLVAVVAETLLGRTESARARAAEALAAAREAGDPVREGRVLGRQAQVMLRRGLLAEAEAAYQAALALARTSGDRAWEAHLVGGLANLETQRGRADAARPLLDQALALHREVGNRRMEGVVLGNLGLVLQELGQPAEARAGLEAALAIHREVGERRAEAVVLAGLASVEPWEGRPDQARALLEGALAIHRQVGNRPREAAVLGHVAEVTLGAGRIAEARSLALAALVVARELDDPRATVAATATLADVELADGRADEAVAMLEKALALCGSPGLRSLEPARLYHLGRAQAAAGATEAARASYRAGAERAGALGQHPLEQQILAAKAGL